MPGKNSRPQPSGTAFHYSLSRLFAVSTARQRLFGESSIPVWPLKKFSPSALRPASANITRGGPLICQLPVAPYLKLSSIKCPRLPGSHNSLNNLATLFLIQSAISGVTNMSHGTGVFTPNHPVQRTASAGWEQRSDTHQWGTHVGIATLHPLPAKKKINMKRPINWLLSCGLTRPYNNG